jgi:hypothetical protein
MEYALGVLTTAFGVLLGHTLGSRAAKRQAQSAATQAAHKDVVLALSPVLNILWDYAASTGETSAVNLAPSRVSAGELRACNSRWQVERPAVTAVSIGDPSPEIRNLAGELVRSVSLFARAVDRSAGTDQAVRSIATLNDRCFELSLKIEKLNNARVGKEETGSPERLQGVARKTD